MGSRIQVLSLSYGLDTTLGMSFILKQIATLLWLYLSLHLDITSMGTRETASFQWLSMEGINFLWRPSRQNFPLLGKIPSHVPMDEPTRANETQLPSLRLESDELPKTHGSVQELTSEQDWDSTGSKRECGFLGRPPAKLTTRTSFTLATVQCPAHVC